VQQETFNMFWHGDSLSTLEWACMQSFLDHGQRLRVFSYEELAIPAGAEIADASQILPRERLFLFDNSPSAFTNIFRYKLLLEQGGWWVDTDVLCLTPRIAPCEYYWAEQNPGVINGAVLKMPGGDPICAKLLSASEKRAARLRRWGQLGPALLSKMLQDVNPSGRAGSTADVYPVHWLETHFFYLPEYAGIVEERSKGSTFLHFWHSMAGWMGIDPDGMPPEGSFLAAIYERHMGAFQPRPTDEMSLRKGIFEYLSQDWVEKYWTETLGRDAADLELAALLRPCDRRLRGVPHPNV